MYFASKNSKTQLHIFCDSSTKAYEAVAYLRGITESGPQSTLLMAKSRVAPVKQKTFSIPRLELLAALLGARLSQYIIDILAPKFLGSRHIVEVNQHKQ